MAHFAKIVDGIVTNVIVAEPEFFETFVDSSPGEWIQTSYNTICGVHYNAETGDPSVDQTKALRKNYAGVGYTYDRGRDAFIPPKIHTSWLLDEQTCCWKSPNDIDRDGKQYVWNDEFESWDLVPTES